MLYAMRHVAPDEIEGMIPWIFYKIPLSFPFTKIMILRFWTLSTEDGDFAFMNELML